MGTNTLRYPPADALGYGSTAHMFWSYSSRWRRAPRRMLVHMVQEIPSAAPVLQAKLVSEPSAPARDGAERSVKPHVHASSDRKAAIAAADARLALLHKVAGGSRGVAALITGALIVGSR